MENVLAARWYAAGAWVTPQETEFVNLVPFNTSLTSRSLSVTILPNTNNHELLVYFEGPDENVTALHGSKNLNNLTVFDDVPDGEFNPLWTWENLTAQLQSSSPNVTFGSPFFNGFTNTTYIGGGNSSASLQPQAVFFDPQHHFAFSSVYFNENRTFVTREFLSDIFLFLVPADLMYVTREPCQGNRRPEQ